MNSQKSSFYIFPDLFYLVSLASFFLFFGLGRGSLPSWDTAIYAEVSRNIIRSGDWLRLTWAGAPFFDKPPLGFWFTAFFYKIFGINEFAARFFSAVCGVGTVAMTYLFGARLFGRWTGFLGACVLLSSSHFFRVARFGTLDAPLAFFLVLSLYFFWIGREKDRYLVLFGVAAGLGFLVKSFAIFFIFPIILIYSVWAGEMAIFRRRAYWLGILALAVLAGSWFLYQSIYSEGIFLREAVFKHLFLRTTESIEGHTGNFYFYIRTFINKYHPWVLVGIFSVPFFLYKAFRDRKPAVIFVSVWIFFIFTVITLMRTKLQWYLFPVYPAVSLTVALILSRALTEKNQKWITLLFIGIMIVHVPLSKIFMDNDYSREIKAIAPIVHQYVPERAFIGLYNSHEAPAAHFYLERNNVYLDTPEDLLGHIQKNPETFLLIHEKNLHELENTKNLQWELLGVSEGLHLTRVKNR